MMVPTWKVVRTPSGVIVALGHGMQVHSPYRESTLIWVGDGVCRDDALALARHGGSDNVLMGATAERQGGMLTEPSLTRCSQRIA